MALPSTIFRVELHISDMDRHYYATHNLTLARHPSETDERMMARLLAFALHASDSLTFAQGLSSPDEPDLWSKDLQGDITHWIMVGLPDEKQIKKALSRADKVSIFAYGTGIDAWYEKTSFEKFAHVTIVGVDASTIKQLADSVRRSMRIQATIQDGALWWSHEHGSIEVELRVVQRAR